MDLFVGILFTDTPIGMNVLPDNLGVYTVYTSLIMPILVYIYNALISTRVRHVLLSYADIGNKKAEQQKCEVQVLGPCIEVI